MTYKKIFLGIPALSAIGLCSVLLAAPASAFTFSSAGVGITASDIGQSFQVAFDGSVSRTPIAGLSSLATITFLGFQAAGSNTLANLKISLANTSSGAVISRTSAIGFNTSPTLASASITSGGLFSNTVLNGSLPNGFGSIGVCFTNGNTCQGGANGGVFTGSAPGTFSPTLAFSGSVNSFTLSNFGVRYQSISGVRQGTSGTGSGTPLPPPPPPPPPPTQKVPEPGFVGALALTGVAALRSRKRRQVASIA